MANHTMTMQYNYSGLSFFEAQCIRIILSALNIHIHNKNTADHQKKKQKFCL